MTDAYYGTFEFEDIELLVTSESEYVYGFRFRGQSLMTATVPDPKPEELIDALLTRAKERILNE